MPCAQRVTAHRLGRYRRQHELGNGPLTAREFRDQFVGAFRVGRLTILKKGDTLTLPPSRASVGVCRYVLDLPRAPLKKRDTTWVEPRFDAEITYAEINDDGMVRHPVLKALVS